MFGLICNFVADLQLRRGERGAGFNEYVFVALLIFVVLIIGVERVGLIVLDMFSNPELQDGLEQN